METVFIEATNKPDEAEGFGFNWGKFMVARFTHEEWARTSAVQEDYVRSTGSNSMAWMIDKPLLSTVGWSHEHIMVVDLQTGEGGIFRYGGYAKADLDKHQIWVCVLFEPFLQWLYNQDITDLSKLPRTVNLPGAEPAMWGYRRPGPLGVRKYKIKPKRRP